MTEMSWGFIFLKGANGNSPRLANSKVEMCVAFKFTLGAMPASKASFHLAAQRHQQSPGFNPGKAHSGTGVERSLPLSLLNLRKSAVTFTHTV